MLACFLLGHCHHVALIACGVLAIVNLLLALHQTHGVCFLAVLFIFCWEGLTPFIITVSKVQLLLFTLCRTRSSASGRCMR